MKLVAIKERLEDNPEFLSRPEFAESLEMTVKYFASIGYHPPWTGYYVFVDDKIVGSAAFKGKPKNGRVEIAYRTMDEHQGKGIGTEICKTLVELALRTEPSVMITARTLPEESFSTKILKKKGFQFLGSVIDEDDGEVWEWVFEN